MINLEEIRINLSSLVFDNLVNEEDNYSEMEEIYNQLKSEFDAQEAELIFLDIIANIVSKSQNQNYLQLIDNVYSNVIKTDFIIPSNILKQDIINQNTYDYNVEERIAFYEEIVNNESISTEIKYHYNYLLLKDLVLSGLFLQSEYQNLYSVTRNINESVLLSLGDYSNFKTRLAYFN